jgi:hypothetical protein
MIILLLKSYLEACFDLILPPSLSMVILGFFGKNVLLTAKIKNTILVALESAESLYHKFGIQLMNKSVQICN